MVDDALTEARAGVPPYQPLEDRLWPKVDASGDCWEWTAGRNRAGYGTIGANRRSCLAHRVVWELLVGPIPDGMQIDHLCRVHECVNPDHLEVVVARTNSRRGFGVAGQNARKDQCVNGHDLTDPANLVPQSNPRLIGSRICRACGREASAARDRDLVRAKNAAYRKANAEQLKAKAAADYAANRETIRATAAAEYAAHREQRKAQQAAYNKANRKAISARAKARYQAHYEANKEQIDAARAAAREAKAAARKITQAAAKERQLIRNREYYAANRNAVLAQKQEYYQANKAAITAAKAARSSRSSRESLPG